LPKFNQDELQSIHEAYTTGRELVDAGLLEDAIAYFDQILRRLPRRRRDRVYRIEGEKSPPKKSKGVLMLPAIFRDALLAKAFCLNELGRLDDAFALLERAAELDPENPRVYAELGFTFSSQDNLDLAKSAYVHADALEPDNPAHKCALAHIALLEDRFDDARALASRALELDPVSVQAMHQLAFAEYRLDNVDAAIAMLERAQAMVPEDPESVRRLAMVLYEAGRLREAIVCLDQFLQGDSSDADLVSLMTELLQQDSTAPELVPHAQRLLARNAQDPTALDLLAWGYYQQGQLADARDILRQVVRLDPDQPYHHFKLGVIYQALGQLQSAMASFLRATSIDQHGEIGTTAMEAINVLDRVQLEQLVARAKMDLPFRYQLQREPELTLHQTGYLLSPLGLIMLQTLDLTDDDFGGENEVKLVH
jgi:tetratricopeptide (TPR) repeat protein